MIKMNFHLPPHQRQIKNNWRKFIVIWADQLQKLRGFRRCCCVNVEVHSICTGKKAPNISPGLAPEFVQLNRNFLFSPFSQFFLLYKTPPLQCVCAQKEGKGRDYSMQKWRVRKITARTIREREEPLTIIFNECREGFKCSNLVLSLILFISLLALLIFLSSCFILLTSVNRGDSVFQ